MRKIYCSVFENKDLVSKGTVNVKKMRDRYMAIHSEGRWNTFVMEGIS